MPVRGIRGATVVEANNSKEIYRATKELMTTIMNSNRSLSPTDVGCVIFTVTNDLDAAFPATELRQLAGWDTVPLMCSQEIPVPNSLSKVIRVMVIWNTDTPQEAINHVYLKEASNLRRDLMDKYGGEK